MDLTNREIKVFAPATIGNVSCGFDILGLAIEQPGDEVHMRLTEGSEVTITDITGDEGKLPRAANKNTAGIAVLEYLRHRQLDLGVEIELHKKMPIGSGLGSSAASAAAAVFAINELTDDPLPKEAILRFAVHAEKFTSGTEHADNVAPSLLGGLILIRDYRPLRVKQIPTPGNLWVTVVHPEVEILTREAREILPKEIPLSDGVVQWSNVAALICGFYENDIQLIGESMEDLVATPYRSKLIPGYSEARKAASHAGAIGGGISGSGPSVFAISDEEAKAINIGNAMKAVFSLKRLPSDVYISRINQMGARRI